MRREGLKDWRWGSFRQYQVKEKNWSRRDLVNKGSEVSWKGDLCDLEFHMGLDLMPYGMSQ